MNLTHAHFNIGPQNWREIEATYWCLSAILDTHGWVVWRPVVSILMMSPFSDSIICDPPYENTSYPQKRFLGGLRSLWNPLDPGFWGFETLWKRFWNPSKTLLKPFGNPFETLWNPFETLLKPFQNALKLFGNPLKRLGTWEHFGNPLEIFRILFEKPLWKCQGKNILVVCVHCPHAGECVKALHVINIYIYLADILFCRMIKHWFICSYGNKKS